MFQSLVDAQKLLPIATALAIVGCLTFVGGLFRYAGVSWMSLLEPADLFALSWPIIPTMLIAVLAGFANGTFLGALAFRKGIEPPARVVDRTRNRLAALVHVMLLACMGVLAIPAQFAMWGIALIALTATCAVSLIARQNYSRVHDIAVLAFLSLISCYTFGQSFGARPFVRAPDAVLTTQSGERCVNIVALLRRGVLVTEDRSSTEFVEWGFVQGLRTGEACVSDQSNA